MIQITVGADVLTMIGIEGNTKSIELSKWVCDKIYDKIVVKNAYGDFTINTKDLPIEVDTVELSDLSAIRLAIGSNW